MNELSCSLLFPFLLSICCVACNRSLKIRAWPRKKKLTNFSLSSCLLLKNQCPDWPYWILWEKKGWEGDNNSVVVPVIKISPLMALALVVVIRSKKRVTTSSSDPFNKIFRRSVVCVSFFFIHSMPELLYTKDFCNSFIHCVWKFFFQRNEIQQVDMFFFGNVNKNLINSQILFLGKYILINSWKINSSKSIDLPQENYCPYVRIIIIIPIAAV